MKRIESFRVAGGDIVLYQPDDGTTIFLSAQMDYAFVAAIIASPAELDTVLDAPTAHSATKAIRTLINTHNERVIEIVFTELAPLVRQMRRVGYTQLFRSPTDREPITIVARATSAIAQAEKQLHARDADCDGNHYWILSHDGKYDVPVWHLNLTTALIVPPTPLVLRP